MCTGHAKLKLYYYGLQITDVGNIATDQSVNVVIPEFIEKYSISGIKREGGT